MPDIAWLAAIVTMDHFLLFLGTCLPMSLPLHAFRQSQSHLPSRVQSPGPFKPYNSAFCLVIMQLTPAPNIQALLEWVAFLTPADSQVKLMKSESQSTQVRNASEQRNYKPSKYNKQQMRNITIQFCQFSSFSSNLLQCWCFNTVQAGSIQFNTAQ